ncbi:MAG: hypothetical protein ACRBF0_23040 [Calditrichia bacterium]
MKKLIVLVLLLSSSLIAEYNSGFQAVAKIELINGKSFEAIIVIATTPSIGLGYFDQNGFMAVSKKNARLGYLLGSDFNKISFIQGSKPFKRASSSERTIKRSDYRIFFLRGISSAEKGKKSVSIESEIDSSSGTGTYKRTFQIVQEYVLEDSIEVYRYLPSEYELTMGKP